MTRVKPLGIVFLLTLSMLLASCMGVSGFDTMWRIMWSDDSAIEDYSLFPLEPLTASVTPFEFATVDGNSRLPSSVEAPPGTTRLFVDFLTETGTVAFIVIKDDVIIMEEYFAGYEESSPTLAFSMSKSFTSILVGAAIADDYIQSVDQKVTDFVPELVEAGFDQVTIRHLLQMTSGMDYVEEEGRAFGIHNRFYHTDALEEEILNLELAQDPGLSFSYKSGDNALLGLVLARAITPLSITEYTQSRLWDPLGMEYDGGWNTDRPGGQARTWCGLSATARDYAKFGRLYLNNGEWNGAQIIPAEWVTRSTAVDTADGSVWNYQYQWWLVTEGAGDYTALGHLGQFVYVNPAHDVIIVRLGTGRGDLTWDEWNQTLAYLAASIAD